MPITFNEIQMHKTGTDGKRNSESLCWYTAQQRSNTVRRQGRYERKWRPSKTGDPFVSWISTFTGLLVCNGISEPSLRQIRPVFQVINKTLSNFSQR
jgi:hypothetical protein